MEDVWLVGVCKGQHRSMSETVLDLFESLCAFRGPTVIERLRLSVEGLDILFGRFPFLCGRVASCQIRQRAYNGRVISNESPVKTTASSSDQSVVATVPRP